MREKINEEVRVVMHNSPRQRAARSHRMRWQNREYMVDKFGYHHSVFDSRAQYRIFEPTMKNASLWKWLHVTTEYLDWKREGMSDGTAA